jgi:hypothetical protein
LTAELESPLQEFAQACSVAGASAWPVAELPAPHSDSPYRRMLDRSDEYGASLEAWRQGSAKFPELLPGNMVLL